MAFLGKLCCKKMDSEKKFSTAISIGQDYEHTDSSNCSSKCQNCFYAAVCCFSKKSSESQSSRSH